MRPRVDLTDVNGAFQYEHLKSGRSNPASESRVVIAYGSSGRQLLYLESCPKSELPEKNIRVGLEVIIEM